MNLAVHIVRIKMQLICKHCIEGLKFMLMEQPKQYL